MSESASPTHRKKSPGWWSLITVLALGVVPWLVTITMVGIECGDAPRPDEGICGVTSKATMLLLLLVLEMPVAVAWLSVRGRGDRAWFVLLSAIALVPNLVLAVLATLWSSGDLS